MQVKTKGIILKEMSNGEEDKLLSILTEDRGVIFAYAKGANRFKSPLAPFTGLLCYSSMVLFYNREKYSLDHVDGIEQFFPIRESMEKLALASYFAEITAVLGPKEGDQGQFLRLLLNCLALIAKDRIGLRVAKSIFELRAMTISGFMPNLVACGDCGCFEDDKMAFYPERGSLYCQKCMENQQGVHILLTRGALSAMRHIIYAPMEKLFSFTIGPESIRCLNDATECFLEDQTERTYQTLSFFHSVVSPV